MSRLPSPQQQPSFIPHPLPNSSPLCIHTHLQSNHTHHTIFITGSPLCIPAPSSSSSITYQRSTPQILHHSLSMTHLHSSHHNHYHNHHHHHHHHHHRFFPPVSNAPKRTWRFTSLAAKAATGDSSSGAEEQEVKKRGRGRPKKTDIIAATAAAPEIQVDKDKEDINDKEGKKKRGRPKKVVDVDQSETENEHITVQHQDQLQNQLHDQEHEQSPTDSDDLQSVHDSKHQQQHKKDDHDLEDEFDLDFDFDDEDDDEDEDHMLSLEEFQAKQRELRRKQKAQGIKEGKASTATTSVLGNASQIAGAAIDVYSSSKKSKKQNAFFLNVAPEDNDDIGMELIDQDVIQVDPNRSKHDLDQDRDTDFLSDPIQLQQEENSDEDQIEFLDDNQSEPANPDVVQLSAIPHNPRTQITSQDMHTSASDSTPDGPKQKRKLTREEFKNLPWAQQLSLRKRDPAEVYEKQDYYYVSDDDKSVEAFDDEEDDAQELADLSLAIATPQKTKEDSQKKTAREKQLEFIQFQDSIKPPPPADKLAKEDDIVYPQFVFQEIRELEDNVPRSYLIPDTNYQVDFLSASDIRDVFRQLVTSMKQGLDIPADEFDVLIAACIPFSDGHLALEIFEEMQAIGVTPTALSYNTLIYILEKAGLSEEALGVLSFMLIQRFKLNYAGFIASICACAQTKRWKRALTLWKEMDLRGLFVDSVPYDAAMVACASVGHWKQTLKLLKDIKAQKDIHPDEYTYSIAIAACARGKQADYAYEVFNDMLDAGIVPTTLSYNAVLCACSVTGDWKKTEELIQDMETQGLNPNDSTFALLIKALGNGNRPDRILNVLENMENYSVVPSLYTFNIAMAQMGYGGEWERALETIKIMRSLQIEPDTTTYNGVMHAFNIGRQYDRSINLLLEMQSGFLPRRPNRASYNLGLEACARAFQWPTALKFLRVMENSGIDGDSDTYNFVLMCLEKAEQWKLSVKLLYHMRRKGVEPDIESYSTVLQALARLGNYAHVMVLFEEMKSAKMELNSTIYNSLIQCAVKVNLFTRARELLDEMKTCPSATPNQYSYTAVIMAHAKARKYESVLQLYKEMDIVGVAPTVQAYNAYTIAANKIRKYSESVKLFEETEEEALDPESITYNKAIRGLEKIKNWDKTIELLDEMLGKNLNPSSHTYYVAVKIFQAKKDWKRAVDLIKIIKEKGETPSLAIYNAAIACCDKAGKWNAMIDLWKEQKKLEKRAIKPSIAELVVVQNTQ